MQPYDVSAEVEATVQRTLQAMTAPQKAELMMGVDGRDYQDIMRSRDVVVPDVGTLRGFRFRDGSHGVNLDIGQDNRPSNGESLASSYATAFPTESLRGASWDIALERSIGAAIADETAASLNDVLLGPSVNILRHPYWGRAQSSYGEDAYGVGRMGAAFTVGAQEFVLACAKHFGAYVAEKKREQYEVMVDEQTLRELYARPFEMVVQDGGVGCVMTAYHLVNGQKAAINRHLLRDVLKAPVAQGGMGFEGIVIPDLWGLPGSQKPEPSTFQAVTNDAVLAGTDMELPWVIHYNSETLANADETLVEDAARRILTQRYRFGSALDSNPWSLKPPTSTLTEQGSLAPNESHETLAERAALESMVLLVNGVEDAAPVLPLVNAGTVAVIGPQTPYRLISSSLPTSCEPSPDVGQGTIRPRECYFRFAREPALGARGSHLVNIDRERAVGPLDGVVAAAKDSTRVITLEGVDSWSTASTSENIEVAKAADAVVVVVGYTPGDEGEEYYLASGGDRTSLKLPEEHVELVAAVLDLDKPTVIVVETGSVVELPWLTHPNRKQATIWAGYSGMRGGAALGKLIFGQANFSGKLPMTWPAEAALPPFTDTASSVNLGYFFGYREFDRRRYVANESAELVFPFGHGLSYASFEYGALTVPCETVSDEAIVAVTVDIANTSNVDGDEVAMLFVKPPPKPKGAPGERPWKELKSFARVTVPAGATVTAELPLRVRDLRRWEGDEDGKWVLDSGDYTVLVGKNADDAEASSLQATLRLGAE
jgi:beta-glucosidase